MIKKKLMKIKLTKDKLKLYSLRVRSWRMRRSMHKVACNQIEYSVRKDIILDKNKKIPLVWWPVTPNFGDLLSPWLVKKITNKDVSDVISEKTHNEPNYVAVGSIVRRARDQSVVWGSGAFGVEEDGQINRLARYVAVRGPLTRNFLRTKKIKVPEVYGDPALLSPLFFYPDVEVTHDIGIVFRWSEKKWQDAKVGKGIKKISLDTDDIEGVIKEMMSCRAILTSSLHGLIISDTYGIPSAWLGSTTPKGLEFKFYDYFLSVDKVRASKKIKFNKKVTVQKLLRDFEFDDRIIKFDHKKLLDACPMVDVVD